MLLRFLGDRTGRDKKIRLITGAGRGLSKPKAASLSLSIAGLCLD